MYEHNTERLLSREKFVLRFISHATLALLILLFSLGLGVVGYHVTDGFSWLDSLLNASMILGGMGPVDKINSDSGKLFSSFYALFSGIVFIGIAGIIIAPIAHRVLHKLHLSDRNR
ncbi:MAG: hypothetical protein NT118_01185 [Lentisphaerae bacterium]|nr:hypothetical protein [Lentisphaerota bacterium]